MKVLYCFIGYHRFYNGYDGQKPKGSGSYNNESIGGEAHNFSCYNGEYYGFVEPSSHRTITVNTNFEDTYNSNDEYADNILVIWAGQIIPGRYVIVGWYKNARVYRYEQHLPDKIKSKRPVYKFDKSYPCPAYHKYNVYANEAVLIPEENRDYIIEYKERQGYVINQEKFNTADILKYIENYDSEEKKRIERIEENIELLTGKDVEAVVKERVNQDKFRDKMIDKYKCKCAVNPCNINFEKVLIASHIKPWCKSSGTERLSESNGLLLCPNHDKLFDEGYISFDDNGKIIFSSEFPEESRPLMNVFEYSKIELASEMKPFMKYHRGNILK